MKKNGFKKGSYKIAARLGCGKHGLKEVYGYIAGDIGVKKKQSSSYTYWTATYIPSGLLIGTDYSTRQKAFEEGKKILEKTDKSILQKGIEQFQNLLKDFEIETAAPAETTDNSEPEIMDAEKKEAEAQVKSSAKDELEETEPEPAIEKTPFFEGVTIQAFQFGKKLNRIKLTFTGNTKPHKEAIKKLGKAWWNQALSRWEVDITDTPLAANISFVVPQTA